MKTICFGLFALAIAAAAAPLTATVSRSTIGVGETAVIKLSGGQSEGIMPTPVELGESMAGAITLRRLDGSRWEVKGARPCDCQVQFGAGKEMVRINIKVVKK